MNQNKEPSSIKFDTDAESNTKSWQAVKYYNETTTPKIIKWIIKYSGGLVKEENQANYVLLGFVVLAIVVSLFLFLRERGESKILPLPPPTSFTEE